MEFEIMSRENEISYVAIKLNQFNITLYGFYRSPKDNLENFFKLLNKTLQENDRKNLDSIR